jgi:hypothetical protein
MMFEMRSVSATLAWMLSVSAVPLAHAGDYTTTSPNTYVVHGATEACKSAAILVDKDRVEEVSDQKKIAEALDGKKTTSSVGPDGAMQEGGLCKAHVFLTAKGIEVYQKDREMPYDKFWMPYDYRYPAGTPTPALSRSQAILPPSSKSKTESPPVVPSPSSTPLPTPLSKVVRCLVPKGTVVVIGVRRNPYSNAEEYVTQWYIGDTSGTSLSQKKAVPVKWRCEAL